MKLIITESQLKRIIREQGPMGFSSANPLGDSNQASTRLAEYVKANPHEVATIAAIGTAFIPVVGPFLSAGIGLADAALYYKEDDTKTAGMTAMFALMPYAGTLLNKIPGLKQLGQKGLALLAAKLSRGGKNLTQLENQVVTSIASNPELVKSELDMVVKKTATSVLNSTKTPMQAKSFLTSIAKGGLKFAGVTATYGGAYVMYDQLYDALVKKGPAGLTPEQYNYIINIKTENISAENRQAALNIKFD